MDYTHGVQVDIRCGKTVGWVGEGGNGQCDWCLCCFNTIYQTSKVDVAQKKKIKESIQPWNKPIRKNRIYFQEQSRNRRKRRNKKT